MVSKGGVITLVPDQPLSALRGFAKGIRTDDVREKKDRIIVIDSSGWVEFFTDGPLANDYASRLRKLSAVVAPVIVFHAVLQAAQALTLGGPEKGCSASV